MAKKFDGRMWVTVAEAAEIVGHRDSGSIYARRYRLGARKIDGKLRVPLTAVNELAKTVVLKGKQERKTRRKPSMEICSDRAAGKAARCRDCFILVFNSARDMPTTRSIQSKRRVFQWSVHRNTNGYCPECWEKRVARENVVKPGADD